MDKREKSHSTQSLPVGRLTLVATPIGNFADISFRALETLREADLIAAEDTRVTTTLLKHYDIECRLESYHEHNRAQKGEKLIEYLRQGLNIALVTDAGMPCISDPGEDLVKLCIDNDIEISVIPGANAGLSALSASGLDTRSFAFEGFIPVPSSSRSHILEVIVDEPRTIILYEAPHRLIRTLTDLKNSGLGDRKIVLARELSKRYEQWLRMTVSEALDLYNQEHEKPRGEFVLVLEGKTEYTQRCPPNPDDILDQARLLMKNLLDNGIPVKEAARQAAQSGIMKKNELYKIGLDLQSRLD
ncbi:MAG: 16S rRNA (cytidine(1402)-2'-O)-methyltransferase [Eubacteriales bacterium]|nr:16S rRNA (cytidine(1402)-2'-O)-methyltransferase [Eubacteriales bacterium]MDD3196687.1 16S rRNA (cytidine(1402)-2'-O)-methyltransferase [Eubacteriales bacterium]MDD3502596.1 16S rRNA (cytidine(1402)-2'-O)-methyltransferase [Eubacteriales bacterium]MDD4681943.1 16S rRNA (cytidine(1402)-2'-O)-methyltransferase [Eubacteriales bacterium]